MSAFSEYLRTSAPPPPRPVKRKVFISYHHRGDQAWFDYFSTLYGETLEIFFDNSLDGRIRSDDAEYVNRQIREEHIFGSSVTIVLCGTETWKRKYVDWEIRSTLHYKHALLGICITGTPAQANGMIRVPDRYYDNYLSGYGQWIHWPTDGTVLKKAIDAALLRGLWAKRISNSRPKMDRNLS